MRFSRLFLPFLPRPFRRGIIGSLVGAGLMVFFLTQRSETAARYAGQALGDIKGAVAGLGDSAAEQTVAGRRESISSGWLQGFDSDSSTYGGIPEAYAYPNSITVLESSGYIVAYDEARRNPAWAAYYVDPDYRYEAGERPARFITDSRSRSQVRHDDYTHSGYDRGHMAPNWAIATRYGSVAQTETFLMTNIVPQKPALNRGPWRELELAIASRGAPRHGGLWVVTGPLYDSHRRNLKSGVEIPDAFFMVVLDELEGEPRALGYIMPQNAGQGDDFQRYQVSVDEIEHYSGFDLFHELPADTQQRFESVVTKPWIN